MAIDAGTFIVTWPASATTEAGNAIAGNVTSTGVKGSYCAAQPVDVYEIGAVIGTATAATTYVFTAAVDEKIGGTLSSSSISPSNFATVTGPASTAITAGYTLKKFVKFRIPKGGTLVLNVTGAPASGTAMLYAVMAVAGAPQIGSQSGTGGLGLPLVSGVPTVTPNEILSTT